MHHQYCRGWQYSVTLRTSDICHRYASYMPDTGDASQQTLADKKMPLAKYSDIIHKPHPCL